MSNGDNRGLVTPPMNAHLLGRVGAAMFVAFAAMAIGMAGGAPSAEAAEVKLVENGDLVAYANLRRDGKWCGRQVRVNVRAGNESAFKGGMRELRALLGSLPTVLRSQCGKAYTARVMGYVGDKHVYTATISGLAKNPKLVERFLAKEFRPAVGGSAAPPKPGAPSVKRNAGTLFTAQTLGDQCRILADWGSRLRNEYPDANFRRGDMSVSRPPARSQWINLLGDADFIPVFGQPYTDTDRDFRLMVHRSIFRNCARKYYQTDAPELPVIVKRAFRAEGGLFSFKTFSPIVKERREIRAWARSTLAGMKDIPATSEGFDRLDRLAKQAPEKVSTLWPSEQKPFLEAVTRRRTEVALVVARDRVAALPPEAASLEKLSRVVLLAQQRVGDAGGKALGDLVGLADRRRQEIRAAVVDQEIAALAEYPEELDSLARIVERKRFVSKVVGETPPLPVLAAFDKAADRRAKTIAQAALPRFREHLERLPVSFEGARQALEEMRVLRPTLDQAAPVFEDAYGRVSVARADAIYDSLLEQAQQTIQASNGGWRDGPKIIALGREKAAAFKGTRAEGRASALVGIAVARANAFAKSDFGKFRREIAAVGESWAGLRNLDAWAASVAEHSNDIPELQRYGPETATRRREILDALAEAARAEISATGRLYSETARILKKGEEHARRFKNAGAPAHAQSLRQASANRAEQVAAESFPMFEREIAALEATKENAAAVKSRAEEFGDQSERFPAFGVYRQAALARLEEMLEAICQTAVKRADPSIARSALCASQTLAQPQQQSGGTTLSGASGSKAMAAGDGSETRSGTSVPLYKSEVSGLHWSDMRTIFRVPRGRRTFIERQVGEVILSGGQKVIECTYGPSDPVKRKGFRTYTFWYEDVPENIYDMLSSAPSVHPMWDLGLKSVTACPESPKLALKVVQYGKCKKHREQGHYVRKCGSSTFRDPEGQCVEQQGGGWGLAEYVYWFCCKEVWVRWENDWRLKKRDVSNGIETYSAVGCFDVDELVFGKPQSRR